MLSFVVLLCSAACALGVALPQDLLPTLDGRIVGGELTTITSYPWQVSLQRMGQHFCGGAIYDSMHIITAAHCVQEVNASAIKVRAGSSYKSYGGTLVRVAALIYHDGYNPTTTVNDIAVMRLSDPLPISSTIKSIPLATTTLTDGAVGTVSGWGHTSFVGKGSSQLRYVDLKILSRKQCASSTYGYGYKIKPTMLCAYGVGKDSCQGDSGGPLVSGGALVGVVSWGMGCADLKYPGVYTNVADFHSWINATIYSL